jgi:hypothetical protein
MITEAQTAANKVNAAFSTGPKTPEGKARSSKNALTLGLFTMNDFVRDDEAEDYTKICASLWSELTPEGTLEQNFTTEIVRATWRLRRCRMADETLGLISITDPAWSDPMLNPATEKQQKSVDRARAQAHNALRRSIAELRALQTERTIRLHLDVLESIPGLTNTRQLLQALKVDNALNKNANSANHEEKPKEEDPAAVLEALMAAADQQLCQQVRDSVTKESMSRPYPNSDHSEDQQPLVGGGAGASACPDRDSRSGAVLRNTCCRQRINRQALSQQRPLRRPATPGQHPGGHLESPPQRPLPLRFASEIQALLRIFPRAGAGQSRIGCAAGACTCRSDDARQPQRHTCLPTTPPR